MTRTLFAMAWLLYNAGAVVAQVQPSDQISQFVEDTSEAFLIQLVKEDFAAERAFMSDRLAKLAPPDTWREARKRVIEQTGKTQPRTIHGLTYYSEENLLAAVDFSGQGAFPGTFICGFMLWELPTPNAAKLVRFEQNVVPVATFRKLSVTQAAQTMTNWRCPDAMIESVLDVSLQ